MEKVLPYLEYKSTAENVNISVGNYVGLSVKAAETELKRIGISYEIVGDGSVVLAQTPSGGDIITTALSKVILYTSNTSPINIKVPNLRGLSLTEAIKLALSHGFNIRLLGNSAHFPDADDVVFEQSLPPDMMSKHGTVITIRAIENNFED